MTTDPHGSQPRDSARSAGDPTVPLVPGVVVVHRVSFGDVVEALAAARDLPRGSGPWTRRMLAAADVQFAGHWGDVRVSGAALLDVWLPRHAGEPCHGDRREVVPPEGASVRDTAAALSAWDAEARAENAECSRRLDAARAEPVSRVILARAPLAGHPDYAGLPRGRPLYHLDGFHRLVAWAMAGRLRADDWYSAHVAGA